MSNKGNDESGEKYNPEGDDEHIAKRESEPIFSEVEEKIKSIEQIFDSIVSTLVHNYPKSQPTVNHLQKEMRDNIDRLTGTIAVLKMKEESYYVHERMKMVEAKNQFDLPKEFHR